MRFATAILLFFCGLFGSRAETDSLQILTRKDMNFSSPWAHNEQTLVNGNWYVRLDPDLSRTPSETRTQIVVGVNLLGEAGTYNFWSRCIAQNWATSGNTGTGTMEFRLGTNGWSNALFSTSWRVTNYVAATPFTNGELRFTQPHPIDDASTLDQYDIRLEGVAITTNSLIGNAYGDAFLDYSVPALADTNSYITQNLIPNSSAELGFFWSMFDRKSPDATNDFKATFLDQAEWSGDASVGSKSYRIDDDYIRYAFYLSPIELRHGVRQYTLSWDEKTTATYQVLVQNIADTNASIPVTSTNRGSIFTFTAAGTNSWTRRSTNFWICDLPTPEWEIRFNTVGSGTMLFDNIMLTEGTSTNWMPKQGVEYVIKGRRLSVYNETEPIDLSLIVANYGASSSNFSVQYTAHNVYGSPVFSGEFSNSVPSGLSTNFLRVPQWIPYGFYRVASRSSTHPAASECLFSKILYPDDTNGVIQLHGHPSQDASRSNVALGFSVTRTLSPGGFFRVDEIQPTEGNFSFSLADWKVEETLRGGMRLLASTWTNGDNPAWWASPVTAMPDTNKLASYITALASRYSGKIWAWESRNEPMNFISSNNQAVITRIESDIFKTLDPGALYVALGGIDDHVKARNALSLMDSNTLARVDAISCHLYPQGGNVPAHMTVDNSDRNRYAGWRDLGIQFNKPVWNSESGQWDAGPMRGRQMGYLRGARYAYPFLAVEDTLRSAQNGISRKLMIGARSIGHGFARWFLYDGRFSAYRAGNETETTATIFDYGDEVRPAAAAVMTMKRLVDPPTFSHPITNIAFTDAYVVSKAGKTFAMIWCHDKTNRTITLSSTNYGVLDLYGNQIQTNQAQFRAGRMLVYLVSDSIATNTMISMLETAGVSLANDTTPPIITADVYPAGMADGSNNVWFKFLYLDDTVVNTPLKPNQILARWRTRPNEDWSAWSEESIVHRSGLKNGPHRFEVQAKDFYNNTSSTAGLSFTITNGVVVQWETFNTGSATANNVIISN